MNYKAREGKGRAARMSLPSRKLGARPWGGAGGCARRSRGWQTAACRSCAPQLPHPLYLPMSDAGGSSSIMSGLAARYWRTVVRRSESHVPSRKEA